MCSRPKIEEPTKYQASKEPVFRQADDGRPRTGRRGTLLTGSGGAGQEFAPSGKKTLLGM